MARRGDDRRSKAREMAKKQAEENKYSGGSNYLKLPDDYTFLKIKKGTMELDFIPFEIAKSKTVPDTPKRDLQFDQGDLWWHRSIFVHRNVGPEKKTILCPRTFKKPCPICEERQALMDSDYESNKKLIGDLKPQHKDLMFAIDLGAEKEGVKVVEFSYANLREKIENELREQNKDEFYDFFQLDQGYTLRIRFLEESFNKTVFFKADRIDFDKRNDYDESILKETFDFDDYLVMLPYEQINKIFLGIDDEEKEEESQCPSREGRSSRRSDQEEEPEKETRSSRRPSREEDPEPEKEERTSRRSSREEDPEPEKEERTSRRSSREEESKKDDRCPSGGNFGYDCDKLDACPDCPKETWETCADEFDDLKKQGKIKK